MLQCALGLQSADEIPHEDARLRRGRFFHAKRKTSLWKMQNRESLLDAQHYVNISRNCSPLTSKPHDKAPVTASRAEFPRSFALDLPLFAAILMVRRLITL